MSVTARYANGGEGRHIAYRHRIPLAYVKKEKEHTGAREWYTMKGATRVVVIESTGYTIFNRATRWSRYTSLLYIVLPLDI